MTALELGSTSTYQCTLAHKHSSGSANGTMAHQPNIDKQDVQCVNLLTIPTWTPILILCQKFHFPW